MSSQRDQVRFLSGINWQALPPEVGVKVMQLGEWVIATSTFVDEERIFVSNAKHVVALHPDAWHTLGADVQAQSDLLLEATMHWASLGNAGFRRLADCEAYLRASKAEAFARPQPIEIVDTVEDLTNRAGSLITQAAQLSGPQANARHITLFAQTLGTLQAEIADMERRIASARAAVTLAEDAVLATL